MFKQFKLYRRVAFAIWLVSTALSSAAEPWVGSYGGFVAYSSRQTTTGTTLKADGTFGSRASGEAANFQTESNAPGLLFGKRKRFNSGLIGGFEADLSVPGLRARSSNLINTGAYVGQPSDTLQYDLVWLATTRAVVGWSVGDWLMYGTGGAAFMADKVERTQYKAVTGTTQTEAMFSETDQGVRLGAVLGAGAEWRLGALWSLRAEYLYMRFPNHTSTFQNARGGAQASYTDIQGRVATNDTQINTLRVGLSYLFQ